METPPASSLISASGRRVRSTSSVGLSTSSFIRSRTFVPPARNFDCGLLAAARTAMSGSVARTYLNGLMAVLFPHAGQLLLAGEAPGVPRLAAGVNFLHRGDDLGIGAAAAEVPAHALADLVVGHLCARPGDVLCRVAGLPRARLGEKADRGADLPRSAVAALEGVVLDEGGLHGVELVALCEAFDGRDLAALQGGGEGQAGQHAPAVDEDSAGPALALVAALLRAREVQPLAQGIEQDHARVELQPVRGAVHLQGHRDDVLGRYRRGDRIRSGPEGGERFFVREKLE